MGASHPVGAAPQVRNDAIADALDVARRRMKKLEGMAAEATLKLDTTEVCHGHQAMYPCPSKQVTTHKP